MTQRPTRHALLALLILACSPGELRVPTLGGTPHARSPAQRSGTRYRRAADRPVETAGMHGWTVHIIADEILGSDGLSLADIDGDGDVDMFGAWEAGGAITAHLNPGASSEHLRDRWPSLTITDDMRGAEGVTAADIDGDGRTDVVAASELVGARIYFQPPRREDDWPFIQLPVPGAHRWLETTLADLDGDGLQDIVGRPSSQQVLAWMHPGHESARRASAWTPRRIGTAKHVMSMHPLDLDGDDDLDLLISQRASARGGSAPRGLFWVENGNAGPDGIWARHDVAAPDRAGGQMTCLGDLDNDGDDDLVWPTMEPAGLSWFEWNGQAFGTEHTMQLPAAFGHTARSKSCAIGDIDGDGDADMVVTAFHGPPNLWLVTQTPTGWEWSGLLAVRWATKLDDAHLVDLTGDGCLDIVSSEEASGRGLFFAENPGCQ